MFFWMVLLTLFSSILIYAFYPRNDAVTMLDQPVAEIAVTDILTQHLAAEQAATLMIKNPTNGQRKMAYVNWVHEIPYTVPQDLYEDFIPAGYTFSNNDWHHGDRPITKIFCIRNGFDNTKARLTTGCGVTEGASNTTDFLVTYGRTPVEFGEYIRKMSPQALGRKLFLTEYTNDNISRTNTGEEIIGTEKDTRAFGGYSLKTNCGILKTDLNYSDGYGDKRLDFDPDSARFLDNTRFYTVRLPKLVSGPKDGDLVCITRLSVSYETDEHNNLRVIYPFNLGPSSDEGEDIGD